MRYVLAVKQPIYGTQGAYLAYQFANSLIERGHQISQIFFFQNAVSNGNAFVSPANDEFNLQKHWQQLSQQHNIALHLCIAASQRRGIVDTSTATLPNYNNVAEHFILAGLGEFNRAVLEADRLITI